MIDVRAGAVRAARPCLRTRRPDPALHNTGPAGGERPHSQNRAARSASVMSIV